MKKKPKKRCPNDELRRKYDLLRLKGGVPGKYLARHRAADSPKVTSSEEQWSARELAALRAAIDDGDSSGIARGNVFAQVLKSLKLSASR